MVKTDASSWMRVSIQSVTFLSYKNVTDSDEVCRNVAKIENLGKFEFPWNARLCIEMLAWILLKCSEPEELLCRFYFNDF